MTDEDKTPVEIPAEDVEEAPETAPERPRRVASEGENGRRAALAKLIAAVLVALPGSYAAVRTQYAADEDVVKTEVKVRDVQEAVIQKHVEAIRREIEALRKSSVTHRELLDLVLRLRDRERVPRPRSPARAREAEEDELQKKIETLRKRDAAGKRARSTSAAVQRKLPAFRPAPALRKAIRKGGDPLRDMKL